MVCVTGINTSSTRGVKKERQKGNGTDSVRQLASCSVSHSVVNPGPTQNCKFCCTFHRVYLCWYFDNFSSNMYTTAAELKCLNKWKSLSGCSTGNPLKLPTFKVSFILGFLQMWKHLSGRSSPYFEQLYLPANGKSITVMAMFLWKKLSKAEKMSKSFLALKVGHCCTIREVLCTVEYRC